MKVSLLFSSLATSCAGISGQMHVGLGRGIMLVLTVAWSLAAIRAIIEESKEK